MRGLLVVDRFGRDARALRDVFDERLADPRSTRADRFAWDYWHVPGQYTHLRTPAWTYFPRRVYERFHRDLVAWGRDTLGCHDISPPWLSLYVEGCRQELHGDLPHGPWAFVYSLTRGAAFRGGETLLVRDDVLDFWADFRSERAVEQGELIRRVAPRFSRLVVFDPRIPHGVSTVTGTHDPRAGRLVIHGWFVQPRPFIRGPLTARALGERIGELTEQFPRWIGGLSPAGTLAVSFSVDRAGAVRDARVLADTTRVPRRDEPARRRVVKRIVDAVRTWRFARQRAPSRVTLPLVFERG